MEKLSVSRQRASMKEVDDRLYPSPELPRSKYIEYVISSEF